MFKPTVTIDDQEQTLVSCVATSPSFSGRPPWTITATDVSAGVTTPTSAKTFTFDPASDILAAVPALVFYVGSVAAVALLVCCICCISAARSSKPRNNNGPSIPLGDRTG